MRMKPWLGRIERGVGLLLVLLLSAMVSLTFADLSVDLFDRWLLQPGWRPWHKAVDVLIAAVLGLIAWEYTLAVPEAQAINEVSPALTIPRSWMYAFMAFTTALSALLALFAAAPRHEHLNEEAAS
jgi:TRAP-type transport system small permease protein